MTYAAPGLASGHAALQVAHKLWNGSENSSGDYAHLGFLYLYELLTGTKKVKILDTDCSRSYAILLAELISDKAETAFLPSILSSLCRYPHLANLLPKFKDNRKYKNSTIVASDPGEDSNGNEVMGPLGSLLAGCMNVLQAEIYNLMASQNAESMFPSPSSDPVDIRVLSMDSIVAGRMWVVPQISNYSCASGTLNNRVEGISTGEERVEAEIPDDLLLTDADLDSFSTQPLKSLNFDDFIKTVLPDESSNSDIYDKLPFDVSAHHMAKTAVARSMINRLETDVADYAHALNTQPKKTMLFLDNLSPALCDQTITLPDDGTILKLAADRMDELISRLEGLRGTDSAYIERALPWLLTQVNSVALGGSVESTNINEIIFELKRYSGQEAHVWLEFLFGTMLSSKQCDDLQQLNPFLSATKVSALNKVVCAAVLHANRIGQINRCLIDARSIQKTMKTISHVQRNMHLQRYSTSPDVDRPDMEKSISSLFHDIRLKADSLILNLEMGRHYMSKSDSSGPGGCSGHEGGEAKRQKVSCIEEYDFDPRFLLFEFTWNILLRKVQVQMVRDYISDLRGGQSSVKQMIMGKI